MLTGNAYRYRCLHIHFLVYSILPCQSCGILSKKNHLCTMIFKQPGLSSWPSHQLTSPSGEFYFPQRPLDPSHFGVISGVFAPSMSASTKTSKSSVVWFPKFCLKLWSFQKSINKKVLHGMSPCHNGISLTQKENSNSFFSQLPELLRASKQIRIDEYFGI